MRFAQLADASIRVAATPKRSEKVAALAETLRVATDEELPIVVWFLIGRTPLGRIGVGWSLLADVRPDAAAQATLSVVEVDRALRNLEDTAGTGSQSARRDQLADLLARATAPEQRLLRGILGGELRQGALEGVMTTAVATAAGVPVAAVRRAAMMAGDLAVAASAARSGGVDGLAATTLDAFCPVLPMLASTSASVAEAMDDVGQASVEWKL
ncbi:MAG: ATP-dependent DNA ligase, partial [Ilumatobacter sp.]